MLDLAALPVFSELGPDALEILAASVEQRSISTNTVLFYEGDPITELMLVEHGTLKLSRHRMNAGTATAGQFLDLVATLGSLPHRVKAVAISDVMLKVWHLEDLWQSEAFLNMARRYLAQQLEQVENRRQELEAPIHYRNDRADLCPGPFRFEDVTLIFAFCDGRRAVLESLLPPGLALLERPGRKYGGVLLAFADFPDVHAEHTPAAKFGYTETTVFVPVRYKRAWGLYVPYIYPSTWEPVLLGRELYGFPKRLGHTKLGSRVVSLTADSEDLCHLEWASSEPSSEARLVGAFSDMLGIMGQITGLAFQAGELLRKAIRLPAYRRVDVYNHRRILSPDATLDELTCDVDQLTRATFGVLGWQQILYLKDPRLAIIGKPLDTLELVLREAYRTKLEMRLGTGRVIQDYRLPGS